MTPDNDIRPVLHLYARAGFGLSYHEAAALSKVDAVSRVETLFKKSEGHSPLSIPLDGLPDNKVPIAIGIKKAKSLSPSEKKKLKERVAEIQKALNVAWMNKLASDKAQLREKMTLFWHGHFACRSRNPVFALELNNIEREHALGNFRDLLLGVSKSPAMLEFLNNQQNRKSHPNENFARELMELFTIGRGNYTEQDIKEAARAFTGWAFSKETWEFEFRENQHDNGQKTFMGKSGNFGGEDIIDMILEKKETAEFLCRKLYRFFVNDIPDEEFVLELATTFYTSGYDIGTLMRKLLTSEHFYKPANVGTRIKSPVEFIVMMNRMFDVKYEDPEKLLLLQRGLGQVLFDPPNVAGWPGGKAWIDSTTLMLRLRIPSVVLNSGIIEFQPKEEVTEEVSMKMQEMQDELKDKVKKQFRASADLDRFIAGFPSGTGKEDIAAFILAAPLDENRKKMVNSVPGEQLKELIIQLVSIPEYQVT